MDKVSNNYNMPRIIFITSTLAQPRIIKRIMAFQNAGFDIKVYGYNRGLYNCNRIPDGLSLTILGNMGIGESILFKLRRYKHDIKKIINEEKETGTEIFYTFDFATAFLLRMYNVRYISEISDILYGYPRYNKVRAIFKAININIVKKSLLTVMTSAGFQKYLFKHPQSNIFIQPNKLNPYFENIKRPERKSPDIKHLHFAYIGAPRSAETILKFAKIIGRKFPQHTFHFFGTSAHTDYFMNQTFGVDNIIYHGSFKNPDDLTAIYANIDLVVACYETEALNERILEPNKLYEAIYFKKPIIVSQNSYLADRVKDLNCGYAINAYSDSEIINFINDISTESIESIQSSETAIPAQYTIDTESDLLNRILELSNKNK